MRKFSLQSIKQAGITDIIIAICVLMAMIGAVVPSVSSALLYYPPLSLVQPYRFITAAFLHAGFWHLVFNMINLYLVGTQLEHAIGKWRYLVLYLLSAVGGHTAVLVWAALTGSWSTAVVGASGAIFGLFGALIALAGAGSQNFRSILVFCGINLAYGFLTPGVSWQAHLGGFAAGLVLAWLWKFAARTPKKNISLIHALIAAICALALVLLVFVCCR